MLDRCKALSLAFWKLYSKLLRRSACYDGVVVFVNKLGATVRASPDLSFPAIKRTKRFCHSLENFVSAFLKVLGACKDIVNIATTADFRIEGIVYEILNVLFTVSRHLQFPCSLI